MSNNRIEIITTHWIVNSKIEIWQWWRARIYDIILSRSSIFKSSQLLLQIIHIGKWWCHNLRLLLFFNRFWRLGHFSLASIIGIIRISSWRLLTSFEGFQNGAGFELTIFPLFFPTTLSYCFISEYRHKRDHVATEIEVLRILFGDRLTSPFILIGISETRGHEQLHLISLLFLGRPLGQASLHTFQSLHLIHQKLLLRRGIALSCLHDFQSICHGKQLAVVSYGWHG